MKLKQHRLAIAVQATIGILALSAGSLNACAADEGNAPVSAASSDTSTSGQAQFNPDSADGNATTTVNEKGSVTSKSVISRDALDSVGAQNAYDAIKNVPGVVDADTKNGATDDLQIRGIHLSSSSSYRVNGGWAPYSNIPLLEDKERIEALKGVGALVYGMAPPAGIIEMVTKRAMEKPIASLGLSFNQFGQFIAAADVGRKFGDRQQFGIRANLAGGVLQKGIEGAHGTREFGSVALDWAATDRLKFKFDVETYDQYVIEQTVISQLKPVKGVVPLPRLPDPTKLLSGPWAGYRTRGVNVLAGVHYQISDDWKVLAETGYSQADRVYRHLSRFTNYNLATGQGTEKITLVNDQVYTNKYAKVEAQNHKTFGAFTSTLNFGVDRYERDFNNPSTTVVNMSQNLYNPVALPAPGPTAPLTYAPQQSSDVGIYAYDKLDMFERFHLLGGMRHTTYHAENFQAHGETGNTTDVWSPAAGVVFDITPNTSVYASYMKALEETAQAPLGSANQFQILPPAKSTQAEAGIRATNIYGLSATLAYFRIDRANAIVDPVTNVFGIDGTVRFEGLESTATYNFYRDWTFNAGWTIMHAVQYSPDDKAINGLSPENTPKFAGNLSVTWHPHMLYGLSMTAGMMYTGVRPVNPQGQGTIPSVTLFSLAAGYRTTIANHRVAFNLSATNLFNRRYWSSAVNGDLGVGLERTIKGSVKIFF
ncbi:MAG TPA: TonB-dependent siderophore receptor [Paraburkholderia sp.]|uniref:TonB-dependent siderophore receptor n=1 Tax=Paraburkholderia sp. TaxID=1926495 RepID=UPI002ED02151